MSYVSQPHPVLFASCRMLSRLSHNKHMSTRHGKVGRWLSAFSAAESAITECGYRLTINPAAVGAGGALGGR